MSNETLRQGPRHVVIDVPTEPISDDQQGSPEQPPRKSRTRIVLVALVILFACALGALGLALLVGGGTEDPGPTTTPSQPTPTTRAQTEDLTSPSAPAPADAASDAVEPDADPAPGDVGEDLIEVRYVVGRAENSALMALEADGLTPNIIVGRAPADPSVCRYDEVPPHIQLIWHQDPAAGEMLAPGTEVQIYACPPATADIDIAD